MKIYLGSAAWDYEKTGFAQSMRLLERALDEAGIPFMEGFVIGDALVSRARSLAASAFLRSDCDVFLSIDTDIWFRAVDAIKLAGLAEELGVVGGLYATRGLQQQPAMMLPDHPIVFAANSEPVEVPFLSTGFLAIHRSVFEKLIERSDELAPTVPDGLLHPDVIPLCHETWDDRGVNTSFRPFFWPVPQPWPGDGFMYTSEDWAFCQRVKNAGLKLWLDPSIRLGHYGTYMFTLEDMLRPDKEPAAPLILHRLEDGSLKRAFVPKTAYIPSAEANPPKPKANPALDTSVLEGAKTK